jgi:uncharacterized protein YfaS (alpha-2-macroglobulin family)
MQQYGGGFGLWDENSPTEQWLSAYALDFLTRARELNYLVPQPPYQRGLDWLKQTSNEVDYQTEALAFRSYALYVLARAQQAQLGDMRYLHDNYLAQLPTQLARAQLGAALARYGDLERAREAFELALGDAREDNLHDYGSPLRDQAAVLALLSESSLLADHIPDLADHLADTMNNRQYTSTQEQSWLLLAAHALLRDGREPLQLAVNGQMVNATDDYYLNPDRNTLEQGVGIVNLGNNPVWYVLNTNGVPAAPQPPAQEGFNISRRYYTRNGEEVNPTDIRQNDLLVAVITGEALTGQNHQALIVDLLPAGLEVENAKIGNGESTNSMDWLPQLSSTSHTDLLDDRYIAALDLQSDQRQFALAYMVRAVTPGDYALPAVFVEDMYKPWYHARGTLDNLRVQ